MKRGYTTVLVILIIGLIGVIFLAISSCEFASFTAAQLKYSPALKQIVCTMEAEDCVRWNRPCMAAGEFVYLHPYCFIHEAVGKNPCRHLAVLFTGRSVAGVAYELGEGICPFPFDDCFVNHRSCIKIEKGDFGYKRILELLKHPQCVTCGNYLVENKCEEHKKPGHVLDQDGSQKTFTLTLSVPGITPTT